MRATAITAALLFANALCGCSILVSSELEGKNFDGDQDGGSRQDAGGGDGGIGPGDDGGGPGPDGGSAGHGGGGSGSDAGGGTDAGDGGGAMDGGSDGATMPTLSVVSTEPADGDTSIHRFGSVQVVFSSPVDEIADYQLEVTHRETGNPVDGSVLVDGDTATFTPDAPMLLAGHYDVVVDSAIATPDGTALDADYTFTFRIVSGFAGDADWIDRSDTPGGSEPDVAVDHQGNAIAVWLQRSPGGSGGTGSNAPWAAHYTHGEGWGMPRQLDMPPSGGCYSPKIAMAPDGRAIAAWTYDPGYAGQPSYVVAAAYDPDSGWASPVTVDSDPDLSLRSQHVAVAMNASGTGLIAWVRGADSSANGQGNFYVETYDSVGATYGAALPVMSDFSTPDNIGGFGRIEALIGSDGRALLGATMGFNGHGIYQQVAAGGSTFASLNSEYDYEGLEGMAIALDADEVAYSGANAPEGSGVRVARLGTSPKYRITTNADADFDPWVSMAASKEAVAAWLAQSTAATTTSVWAIAFNTADDDWALTATDVFPDRTMAPSPPDTAAYLDDGALVAFTSGGELYTVERESGAFGDAVPRPHVENPVEPWVRVAASPTGMGVMVWVENDGVNPPHVAAQTFRGRAP